MTAGELLLAILDIKPEDRDVEVLLDVAGRELPTHRAYVANGALWIETEAL